MATFVFEIPFKAKDKSGKSITFAGMMGSYSTMESSVSIEVEGEDYKEAAGKFRLAVQAALKA